MSFSDGARLMRASFDLVRRDGGLLWFPIGSACCLVLTTFCSFALGAAVGLVRKVFAVELYQRCRGQVSTFCRDHLSGSRPT